MVRGSGQLGAGSGSGSAACWVPLTRKTLLVTLVVPLVRVRENSPVAGLAPVAGSARWLPSSRRLRVRLP